ncbi:MAG: hypothetical protein CMP09_00705 [Yangia sp.]|nr:hypothetical protein [Salipiger sp.]
MKGLSGRGCDGLGPEGRRGASCLIPRFDGAIHSLEWKEARWDSYVTAAPRPRTPFAIAKATEEEPVFTHLRSPVPTSSSSAMPPHAGGAEKVGSELKPARAHQAGFHAQRRAQLVGRPSADLGLPDDAARCHG